MPPNVPSVSTVRSPATVTAPVEPACCRFSELPAPTTDATLIGAVSVSSVSAVGAPLPSAMVRAFKSIAAPVVASVPAAKVPAVAVVSRPPAKVERSPTSSPKRTAPVLVKVVSVVTDAPPSSEIA